MNAVAIMQPYAFPYLGYFNLVSASECFVFYDDVNFIPRGWINRNRLLIDRKPHQFSIPLAQASQNRRILDIELHEYDKFRSKFLKQLTLAYRKSLHYEVGMAYVEDVLSQPHQRIADLAVASVDVFFRRLGVRRRLLRSSECFASSVGAGRSDRLIEITKTLGATHYINPASGVTLYDKLDFRQRGIELQFLQPLLPPYSQAGQPEFVAGLSIIDVLMNNGASDVKSLLSCYHIQ